MGDWDRIKGMYRGEILSVLITRFGPSCRLCGIAESVNPSVDHIIPRSLGGGHCWGNLQVTCSQCNWDKGNTCGSSLDHERLNLSIDHSYQSGFRGSVCYL